MAIYQNNNGIITSIKSIYANSGGGVVSKINKKYETINNVSQLVYDTKVWIIKDNQIVGDTSVIKQYYGRSYASMSTSMIKSPEIATYIPVFETQNDGVKITLQNYTGTQYTWDYSVLYVVVNNQVKLIGGDASNYLAYLRVRAGGGSDAKASFFGRGGFWDYTSGTNYQRSILDNTRCDKIYNFLGGAMGSRSNFSLGTGYLKDVSAIVHNLYYYD